MEVFLGYTHVKGSKDAKGAHAVCDDLDICKLMTNWHARACHVDCSARVTRACDMTYASTLSHDPYEGARGVRHKGSGIADESRWWPEAKSFAELTER